MRAGKGPPWARLSPRRYRGARTCGGRRDTGGGGPLALPGRRLCLGFRHRQQPRGIDQRHMRQRLRKISEHAPAARIVLLGEQAHIVAQGKQPLEQRLALRAPARRARSNLRARTSTARTRPRRPATHRRRSRWSSAAPAHRRSARARWRQWCRARADRRAAGSPLAASATGSRPDAAIRRTARKSRVWRRIPSRRPPRGSHRVCASSARAAPRGRRARRP